jgi:hypothetical protein
MAFASAWLLKAFSKKFDDQLLVSAGRGRLPRLA